MLMATDEAKKSQRHVDKRIRRLRQTIERVKAPQLQDKTAEDNPLMTKVPLQPLKCGSCDQRVDRWAMTRGSL